MISEHQRLYLSRVFQTRINAEMIWIVTQLTTQLMHYSLTTTMEVMPPSVPIFLAQLCQDTQISPAVLFVAAIYLKRLRMRLPLESTGNFY